MEMISTGACSRRAATTAWTIALCAFVHAQPPEAWEADGVQGPTAVSLMRIPQESPFIPPAGMRIPATVDLSPYFPTAGNQYHQSSCTGWALGYGLATYERNTRLQQRSPSRNAPMDPEAVFSPAFLYDMTMQQFEKGADCTQGTQLTKAISVACEQGCCTWSVYPYDSLRTSCLDSVPPAVRDSAASMRLFGPLRLEHDNALQWKYHLSQGYPIIAAISYDTAFSRDGRRAAKRGGDFIWVPIDSALGPQLWGHALVCTGYNDADSLFTVLSSWGTDWGMQGYAFVPYKVMAHYCYEAYIIDDDPPPLTTLAPVPADPAPYTGTALTETFLTGEYQLFNGIRMRLMHVDADKSHVVVEFADADDGDEVHTMELREDQPGAFFHEGHKWTFTFTSAGWFRRPDRTRIHFRVLQEDDDGDPAIARTLEQARRLQQGQP
jgi:hypothetical protein